MSKTVKVEVMRAEVPTMNGRIYPRWLLEREIEMLLDKIESRRFIGWPVDARAGEGSPLGEASHLVTKMSVEDDGRVMAQVECLDTKNGKDLRDLIEFGAKLSFGPTGFGSVRDGVVQSDFVLRSIDVDLPKENGCCCCGRTHLYGEEIMGKRQVEKVQWRCQACNRLVCRDHVVTTDTDLPPPFDKEIPEVTLCTEPGCMKARG